jgi:amino-acid N-acetyltransferase
LAPKRNIKIKIRKATVKDVSRIYRIVNTFANQDLLLPRSFNQLYDDIRDFWLFEKNGKICGCVSLNITWKDLAEIRSLVVIKTEQNKGIGTKLIRTALNEAKGLEIKKIFVLTKIPEFFEKFGFQKMPKRSFPRKIWSECINCPKFPNFCDEVALMIEMQ